MLLVILLFIPVFVGVVMSMRFHFLNKRWVPLVVTPYIMLVAATHFIIIFAKWRGYVSQSETVMAVRDAFLSYIFPAAYVLICSKSGINWKSMYTVVISGFSVLLALGGVSLCICGQSVPENTQPGSFALYFGDTLLYRMHMIELVLMLQLGFLMINCYKLYEVMITRKLHFSQNSKRLGSLVVAEFVLTFVSILLPNTIWYKYVALDYIYVMMNSILLTCILVAISRGWLLAPILDENEEPAVETITVDNDFVWGRVKAAVEGKKMYLRSDLKISDVAREIATNRTYISRAVNRMVGTNFNAYLNRLRVEEARRIMNEDRSLTLDIVAERAGFTTASSFTKIYTKVRGVNPSRDRIKR